MYYPNIRLESLRNITKISVRIISVQAKVRTVEINYGGGLLGSILGRIYIFIFLTPSRLVLGPN
jgi:hypothetical protein